MGVDIATHRQRIGQFYGTTANTRADLNSAIIAMLLVMAGIKLNPGPGQFRCRYCTYLSEACDNMICHSIREHHSHEIKFMTLVVTINRKDWESISWVLPQRMS